MLDVSGKQDLSLNVYFSAPGVAMVRWDPVLKAAHIEWQGWADESEYRLANNAIIRALTVHKGSRALGDCRNMKVTKQSNQDWSNREWFPRVIAAGLTRLALVTPKSGLAKMNVEDMIARAPDSDLEVRYFPTVDQAKAWLR
jgi:stage II sporulation SpoAA-like protein